MNQLRQILEAVLGKSKATSIYGVLYFVFVLLTQLVYELDGDDKTVAQWGLVAAAFLVMMQGRVARDNNKTSEDVGLK